jgi:lipopolysaccharide transport system permease protein
MNVEAVPSATSQRDTHDVIIEASRDWALVRLRELWEYRELLYFLAWRDIKVRYKQTLLGVLWAILQPLVTMLIFALFFGRLAKIPSDNVPYSVFALAALVPWFFFANSLSQSSNSLVGSANLITKVYFPRLVIPISVVVTGLPDFFLSFAVLLGVMIYYGIYPQLLAVVWIPILLLLTIITALGVALWLSALNVKYRDVRHLVGFLTQIWMFATPVLYPSSLLPQKWRLLYSINPMVGVVEGFRWALLQTQTVPSRSIMVSAVTAILILVTGAVYFRRMEKSFADIV